MNKFALFKQTVYICPINSQKQPGGVNAKKMFTIAIVSNQIQSNHIAWSLPIAKADTIEEAERIANEEFRKIIDELEALPDRDLILGETIIIHDGEKVY